jgi:hypothetical protein
MLGGTIEVEATAADDWTHFRTGNWTRPIRSSPVRLAGVKLCIHGNWLAALPESRRRRHVPDARRVIAVTVNERRTVRIVTGAHGRGFDI